MTSSINYGVTAGSIGLLTVHGGRPPVSWPALVGSIPPSADRRVDRPADRRLADAVADPGGPGIVSCQVLSGLGGVGKTQLAAALARRLWDDRQIDLLVWITATSRSAILTGYAETAARITGIDDPDTERAAARCLSWLNEPHRRRWLVVLDDLDEPNDLTGLWPPTSAGGRTVVTTRRRDAALLAGRHLIDVDVFTPEQAVAYLNGKLARQPQRLQETAELAAALGHLPLALSQAVAYILDRGPRMTCARYRTLLADQRHLLADLAPHALPDEHRDVVAATWTLSIERADRLAPAGLVRPLLETAALLDPNGIPLEVLTSAAFAEYCTPAPRPADRPGRPRRRPAHPSPVQPAHHRRDQRHRQDARSAATRRPRSHRSSSPEAAGQRRRRRPCRAMAPGRTRCRSRPSPPRRRHGPTSHRRDAPVGPSARRSRGVVGSREQPG